MKPMIATRDGACVTAVLDGSTVVLAPTMDYVELDTVGSVIWEAVGDRSDADSIVEHVRRQFDVDATTAHSDVRRYLLQLRDLGLLTLDEGA